MIVIEFGGNTLAEKNQDANALPKPEKPANGDFANHLNSTNCHSQAETTAMLVDSHPSHSQTASTFATLRRWIAANLWKN
jgi:hypothetical protein